MLTKLLFPLRVALVVAFLLPAMPAVAQRTIHVGAGLAYTTIQAGIDAASAGDTVLVAPGTYNENIDFKGKAITVTSSGGAAKTIIDGGQKGPAVTFDTAETRASLLSGFTVQHGGVFDYTLFINGGIYLQNSTPTILNNILTQNNCWTIYAFGSGPLIQGNEISATQDPNGNCSFGGGAGIYVAGNYSAANSNGPVTPPMIVGNTIENNVESGLEDAGGNGGAGIAVWGGSPIIMNNVIRNNASPGGSGGAINLQSGTGVAVIQNLIYGNSAGCGGGAIADQTEPDPRTGIASLIANNTIVNNVGSGTWGFSECIPIAEIYPWPDAYGTTTPASMYLNNIISGSTTYPAVNCSWLEAPSETIQPTFKFDILKNAGGPFFGSYCVDVTGKYNNIVSDPQFVNASTQDYHLKSTSPAIDSGDNRVLQTLLTLAGVDLSKDLDGNPRVQDATGKGCVIDMGAYEYHGTVSDCEDATSETLTSSLNPAMAGQGVTFIAKVSAASGTPTGSVAFLDGSTVLSTQTVSGSGMAAFSTGSLTVGSHTITANYQPTGSFGASSASLVETIDGVTTGTSLSCTPKTIDIDGTAQLVASVSSSGGTPTGSVAFSDNGALLATRGLAGGVASLGYTGSVAGTHTIMATYTPTGAFAGSSANCSEVVDAIPTTSTLTVAPASSTYGSSVTLTATVSAAKLPAPSAPTGTVTFLNGDAAIGSGTLAGGVATLAVHSLAGGSYSLSCAYGGSSIYVASDCGSVPVVVKAAPTELVLSSSNNPYSALSPITFQARLYVNNMAESAGAGKAIKLSVNGQTISLTTDATGSASYTIGTLAPNSYPVTANFAATNDLLASSASLTEVITAVPTSTSLTGAPNPGVRDQAVTLTASVQAGITSAQVSGGNVAFYDGTALLGSSKLSGDGRASLTKRFTTVGAHSLTAVYEGDADFVSSTSAVLKETITAGDFAMDASPKAVTVYTGVATAIEVKVVALQGFNQPLALSCAGLPANASCSFSPSALPDGQGGAKLVIQTAAPHTSGDSSAAAAALGAFALLLVPGWRRRRGLLAGLSVVLLAVGVGIGMAGCGSVRPISGGTPPGTYPIAVTASTTGAGSGLAHSATVTLTVKSLF